MYEITTAPKSLMVHSEYLGIEGYRTTVVAPDEATHYAVLAAVYRVNPEAYSPEQAESVARQIVSMHHPDRGYAEPIKAGGTD